MTTEIKEVEYMKYEAWVVVMEIGYVEGSVVWPIVASYIVSLAERRTASSQYYPWAAGYCLIVGAVNTGGTYDRYLSGFPISPS